MKRTWSEMSGMEVMEADERKVFGRLSGAFFDPENGKLIAFLLGFSRALSPSDIIKWGKDELLVGDEEVLVSPLELKRLQTFGIRRCYFLGKKVLSKSGNRLGKVRDFTLETLGASLLTFEVARGFLWFRWDKRIFSAEDINEITDREVIVKVEPEQRVKSKIKSKLEASPAF